MGTQRRLWATAFVGLFGVGCSEEPTESVDPMELLVSGPHPIGFVETEISYAATLNGEARELPVRLWYPAEANTDAPAALYELGGLVELPTEALDAPMADVESPRPIAVYSHGSGGDGLVAYPIAEHLASHGWVVVAPNHVGNTSLDLVFDREVPRAQTLVDRPADVAATLDWLSSGVVGQGLDGALSPNGVLLIGHSLGGATAFLSAGASLDIDALRAGCEDDCDGYDEPGIVAALSERGVDERIGALVVHAPAYAVDFTEGALAALEVPTMLVTGRLDITTPDSHEAWPRLDGPDDVWLEMPRGGHLSFITSCSDVDPELLETTRPTATMDGCGPDFINDVEAVHAQAAYALGFGLAQVAGEPRWDAALEAPAFVDGFEVVRR